MFNEPEPRTEHSSLPSVRFVKVLVDRNTEFSLDIEGLKRSIQRLDVIGIQEKVLMKHIKIA